MRGHEQRALVPLQEPLQPDQRLEVQVVGRLVQQHRVGTHQQDAGQRHAHLPPARQVADVAVHHLLREAEAGQDLSGARLQRVAAQLVEARLHLAETVEQLVHLVRLVGIGQRLFQLLQLGRDLGHGARAGHHLGHHGPAGHLADVLAEVTDADPLVDGDLPLVRRLLAHDHAEDGRLAGPVRADQPDLLAAEHRRRRVDEQDLRPVLLADLVQTNHEASMIIDGESLRGLSPRESAAFRIRSWRSRRWCRRRPGPS